MVVLKVLTPTMLSELVTSFRAPNTNTTVWPGEFIEIDAPSELLTDATLAIEPRIDSVSSSHLKPTHTWPQPDIVQSIGGKLRLLNNTEEPLLVRKNDHLCQAMLLSLLLLSPFT